MTLPLAALDLLDDLRKAIQHTPKDFAISGFIDLTTEGVSEVVLYHGPQDSVRRSPLPLSLEDTAGLLHSGSPERHGVGNETVLDEKYRLARELKPPDFALSYDLIGATSVLDILRSRLEFKDKTYAHVHQLNVYGPGGFFKPHRDTPKGNYFLGTLTFCLPSTFTGGELIIRQDGETVVTNWAKEVTKGNVHSIGWTFLYSDTSHGQTIRQDLQRILADKDLFARGNLIAFPTKHNYAKDLGGDSKTWTAELRNRLKGADAAYVAALKALGMQWDIQALYDMGQYTYGNDKMNREIYRLVPKTVPAHLNIAAIAGTGADESSSQPAAPTEQMEPAQKQAAPTRTNPFLRSNRIFSSDLQMLQGANLEHQSFAELLKGDTCWRSREMIWLHQDLRKEFPSHYLAYGNEFSVAFAQPIASRSLDLWM